MIIFHHMMKRRRNDFFLVWAQTAYHQCIFRYEEGKCSFNPRRARWKKIPFPDFLDSSKMMDDIDAKLLVPYPAPS